MKFLLNSDQFNALDPVLRAEYEERNGQFYLKTEGEYPPMAEVTAKLNEFRENNRSLNAKKTELDALLKKYEGIDPAEHAVLKSKVTELEKTGIKGKEDLAEIIKAAVKTATAPLEEKVRLREESELKARQEADEAKLENRLRESGIKAGVDDRAISDYINRGKKVFKLVDGEPVARKGDAPIFSKRNPAEELSMDEWAIELQVEAPFLYKPSKGGGSGGSSSGNHSNVKKIIPNDPLEFGKNLEGIAKGEVLVQQ